MNSVFMATGPFRSTFIVLSLFLFFGSMIGQNTKVDSLQQVIADAKDEGSRLKAVNHLAVEVLRNNDPDSALHLINEIFPAVKLSSDTSLLIDVMYNKAQVYEQRQQLDSALIIYEETRLLASKANDLVELAHTLVQIGFIHQQKNEFDKGFVLLKEALATAEKSGDKHVHVRAANALGRSYSYVFKFDSSNIFLNQALEIQKTLGNKRLVAELYVNIGNDYARDGQFDKALENYLQSQQLMGEMNDLSGISFTYRSIGSLHYFNGLYPKSIENYQKSLQTVEGTSHHFDIIQSLDYLGEVYMTLEDYENAQEYWNKASEKWQEVNEDKKNPDFSFKKGRVMFLKKEYQMALGEFLETEKLRKEAGQFIKGDLYWNIGQTYLMLTNYEAARTNFSKALELSLSSDDYITRTKSLYGLGALSEKIGNQALALEYFQEALEIAAKGSLKENEMEAAAGLFRIHKIQNNPANALLYLELSKSIQDSLFNEKNTKEVAKLQASFEFEKEKQELSHAQEEELREQANIRRLLWIALLVAVLMLSIGVFYYRSKQKANAELSKLNEQIMRQKEKLEELDTAKSRFFTNISHEFRTPLMIISGMIDQVNNKPELWLDRGSKMIKRNTMGLLNLVNQILDLRKLESNELKLQMVQADVIKYLRYISESYDSFAKNQGLQLHFLPVATELVMDFDPDKLLRIVTNLLSNAIKYTPKGGHIYFHLDKKMNGPHSSLILRIQDTGRGIDKNELPNIFDRFYQVDDSLSRKGEGTGIGLALSQELVKLLGGKIEVQSQIGKGSTFTVELPVSNLARLSGQQPMTDQLKENTIVQYLAVAQQQEDLLESEKGNGKPRLLVVEDNPDVRQFLVACLEGSYNIEIAEDGQKGIDKAVEAIPDLIVSDVMMPEKNGYELTEILKQDERTNHIPIILLTAKADFESKISGLEKGADAYLAKPFEQRELLVRLEKLLELRTKLQSRYSKLPAQTNKEKIEDPFLQKVYGFIEENLSNPDLDMVRMSRFLGMSRTQVFRKIKALTGKSPTAFIRSFRLQNGKELLSNSDLTISEVAYEVGFSSLNYFSSAFYEEFGVRPSTIKAK